MPEELLEFENTVEDREGRSFVARVLGAPRDDGKWVGWIRFTPAGGGPVIETDRETTQPNRADLAYWATGLTYFYLEGALSRARTRADALPGAAETGPTPTDHSSSTASTASADGELEAQPSPHPLPAGKAARLEVSSLDGRVVERVLGAPDPRPGTVREVPGAGVVVYEGQRGEGADAVHVFAVQFGAKAAGATLANWLWSRLHGLGADVRVAGEPVELTNDALRRAIGA